MAAIVARLGGGLPSRAMTRPLLRACGLLVLLSLAIAVPALAASRHGITPRSPRVGSTVAVGQMPTFQGEVKGNGPVWVYVCRSPKRDAKGVICSKAVIEKAKRTTAGRFSVKPKFFDYPGAWLNTPGTYYWQAHRIACEGQTKDCEQEGPVVKFKVG